MNNKQIAAELVKIAKALVAASSITPVVDALKAVGIKADIHANYVDIPEKYESKAVSALQAAGFTVGEKRTVGRAIRTEQRDVSLGDEQFLMFVPDTMSPKFKFLPVWRIQEVAKQITAAEHDDSHEVLIDAVTRARSSLKKFDEYLSRPNPDNSVVEAQILYLEKVVKTMKEAVRTHKTFE